MRARSPLTSLSFWLVALGAPILVVLGSATVRRMADLPRSAPADVLLALVVFDFAVIAQGDDFTKFVPNGTLRDSLTAIFALLLVVGMFSWAASVFVVERRLSRFERRSDHHGITARCQRESCPLRNTYPLVAFPQATYYLSFLLPSVQLFLNLVPFTYKG